MKAGLKLNWRPLFLLCFFALGFNLYAEPAYVLNRAESVFALDLRKDIIISALSVGVFLSPRLVTGGRMYPNQNISDINVIDRRLMFDRNRAVDIASITLTSWMGALPIIVPIALVEWRDLRSDFCIWFTYGVMYAQALGFTRGTRSIIGRLIGRPRPHYYFDDTIERPFRGNGFPSGTTALAFMPATFLSMTFAAEFSGSRWKIPVIVGSHTLAATVGVGRIISGRHFLTDVLAGAAVGSFFGWLIPTLHRRPGNDDENNVSFHFKGNGAVMSVRL